METIEIATIIIRQHLQQFHIVDSKHTLQGMENTFSAFFIADDVNFIIMNRFRTHAYKKFSFQNKIFANKSA